MIERRRSKGPDHSPAAAGRDAFEAVTGVDLDVSASLRQHNQATLLQLVTKGGYVDHDWYLKTYPDVRRSKVDPQSHYLRRGWQEDRQPNEFFDPTYYRANLRRPLEPGLSELEDYCRRGWLEGLAPSAAFDPSAYVRENPDVLLAGMEPLDHYLRFGRGEGRPVRTPAEGTAALKPPMTPGSIPSMLAEQHLKLLGARSGPTGAPAGSYFDPSRLKIDCIVPDFEAGAGGHMAIFRALYWLEQLGHEVTVWVDYPNERSDGLDAYQDILRAFVPLGAQVRLLEPKDVIVCDVLIATDRWTVWSALRQGRAKTTVYFVQDFETLFYPMSSDALIARSTYEQQLFCICSSPWLRDKVEAFGSRAIDFVYPADPAHYFPPEVRRVPQESPLIAFYARPATGRRAVELALLGLVELAQRGAVFRVAMFGQSLDENGRWPFPVEFHHVLSDEQLGELFRRADIGLVFSATNYSICAIEMMACGLPLVDLDVESTVATYPPGVATLAHHTPAGIADALEGLLNDPELRATRASAALSWATQSEWPKIAADIESALVSELTTKGFREAPSPMTRRGARRATIAIPTYNAGPMLEQVLASVTSQRAPFEYDVLCIDSGSTDGTVEMIQRYPQVKLHSIPKAEFNHGGTRNLAVEMSDSDYVAFLTQDAIPVATTWLSDLVRPLSAVPGAAAAFGRHLPHLGAAPFVRRDLLEHFSLFKLSPAIVNKGTDFERFRDRDPGWLGFLRFYSDNNSCLVKEVWEKVPLPQINFGEDQAWAWNLILAGYSKVYVDQAAVRHSHEYGPEEAFRRARTEAAFFKLTFGSGMGIVDHETARYRVRQLMVRDVQYAMSEGIAREQLYARLRVNAATVEGHRIGDMDDQVVY